MWLTKLLEYDFEIKYKPKCENKAANTLSRLPILLNIIVAQFFDVDDMMGDMDHDPKLAAIKKVLRKDPDCKLR